MFNINLNYKNNLPTGSDECGDAFGRFFPQWAEIFRQINETNPGYPYVQDYIALSSTAIDQGKDKSYQFLPYYIGGGVVVLAGIGAFLFFWLRRKSKGKKVEAHQVTQQEAHDETHQETHQEENKE